MEINPISMKRVFQSVIEQFIGLITSGKLAIGEKLPPERMLAEQFGVSRASIREAFRAMEMIGIIEVRAGGGSYVTDLNIANFITTIAPLFMHTAGIEPDLLEFRKLLETQAVRLAAEKQLQPAIAQLDEAVLQMQASLDQNDLGLGAEADIRFHKAIFTCSGSSVLIMASECVSYLLESSVRVNRARILKNTTHAITLLDQHRAILEAIRQGDGPKAAIAMAIHLQFVRHSLQEQESRQENL